MQSSHFMNLFSVHAMWDISECKWRKLFVFICACHHRCEWTCSLSMIPVGLLLENNLCVLVQGSSVCVSAGTLTDHVRQQNCRLLHPAVTRLICLGGVRTCEGLRAPPPAEGSHGNGCQMKPPGLAHLLPVILSHYSHAAVMKRGEAAETIYQVFLSYVWGQHASCNKREIGCRNVSVGLERQWGYMHCVNCIMCSTSVKLNITWFLCKTLGITIKWVEIKT